MAKKMNIILAILCMSWFGLGWSPRTPLDTQRTVGFNEANQAYEAGEYPKAVKLYEKVLISGWTSGALEYNLGNAYYRTGDVARARLHYERAARFLPRDIDVLENLTFIRRAVSEPQEWLEIPAWLVPVWGWVVLFSAWEWQSAALIIFWIWVSCLAGSLLSVNFRHRVLPWTVLAAMACVLTISGAVWRATVESRDDGIVMPPQVTGFYGPSEREKKAFELHTGAKVRIGAEQGDWVRVRISGVPDGWILKKDIERL